MSLIGLVVTLIMVGVLLWAEETYLPVAAPLKLMLRVVVVIASILFVLNAFGVLQSINSVPVPRVR